MISGFITDSVGPETSNIVQDERTEMWREAQKVRKILECHNGQSVKYDVSQRRKCEKCVYRTPDFVVRKRSPV